MFQAGILNIFSHCKSLKSRDLLTIVIYRFRTTDKVYNLAVFLLLSINLLVSLSVCEDKPFIHVNVAYVAAHTKVPLLHKAEPYESFLISKIFYFSLTCLRKDTGDTLHNLLQEDI